LKVWRKAVQVGKEVIRAIDELDAPRKHYRLIEQLESASTSVAMNIAEGKGRQTTKEFFLEWLASDLTDTYSKC
jgi:four helix bundle protein